MYSIYDLNLYMYMYVDYMLLLFILMLQVTVEQLNQYAKQLPTWQIYTESRT